MKKAAYLLGLGGAAILTGCAQKLPERPNIVLIFTDDQGYGDLECYGAELIETPNIDHIAEEGIQFPDFHVGSSVSSPSRAALLTGCYPLRVGIPRVLFPTQSWGRKPNTGLNPEEETIPELLKEQGYATGMAGKWHLGHQKEFLPLQHGFDTYFGLPYSNDMNMDKLPLIKDNEVIEICPDMALLTRRYTEFSVNFIREQAKEGPFFLYLAHSMPHIPIAASPEFVGKSKGGLYGDVIEEIDWSVGEIVKELKNQGVYDNTLIIFMTDNGPWLSYGNHGGSNGGLREGKFSSYEGGFRVPCVMSYPHLIPAGQVSNQLVRSMDLLPTFCELAGARLPEREIDGRSIVPVLKGETMEELEDRPFFYHFENQLTAVRIGPWKYIAPHEEWCILDTPGKDGVNGTYRTEKVPESLYNMNTDPQEKENVIESHPEIAQKLKKVLDDFRIELDQNKRAPGIIDLTAESKNQPKIEKKTHKRVPSGSIERLTMQSKFIKERPIDIWLPEGYPDEAPYKVVYAHDGGSLYGLSEPGPFGFSEWKVDEIVTDLMKRNIISPCIVVGIHNIGDIRNEEYFPQKVAEKLGQKIIDEMNEGPCTPRADNYLKFIVKELKPYIDQHYKVDTAPASTTMMGSSMGGLISMYAGCEYPEVFGRVACLSTHLIGTMKDNQVIPNAMAEYLSSHLPAPENGNRFYFDYGDQTLDAEYENAQKKVDAVMRKKGYPEHQWQTHFFKGESHSEYSWSRRLDIPLRFLLGNEKVEPSKERTPYRLYVLAGQSNMEGFGYSKDLSEEMNRPQFDVMCFNGTIAGDNDVENASKGVWDFMRSGYGTAYTSNNTYNTYSDRFGPELSFGMQIAKEHPGEKIAIIKYARGGSGIPAGSSGWGTWDPDFQEGIGKNQLDHYYQTLKNAYAVKDIDHDGVEDELIPCGIVWMQGESDGGQYETAAAYYDNLKMLMQLFRASLLNNDLPVVIGKINDSVKVGKDKKIPYDYLIHEAQKKFTEEDSHAAWVCNTDHYQFIEDGWHYQSKDFIDLGIAFAKAMKSLEDSASDGSK